MRKNLRMGAAKVDVTPPVGLSMAGYAGRTNPAIGVHLPLWARAFVCEQELVRVALVVVDTVGFSEDTTERMREAILERTGIAIDLIRTRPAGHGINWRCERPVIRYPTRCNWRCRGFGSGTSFWRVFQDSCSVRGGSNSGVDGPTIDWLL